MGVVDTSHLLLEVFPMLQTDKFISHPHGGRLATLLVTCEGPQHFKARYKNKKHKGQTSAIGENITNTVWRGA